MAHAPGPAAGRPAGGRRLPDDLPVVLRGIFAGEVAERLPGLRSGLAQLAAGDAQPVEDLLRDVHTLAGSAAVVGEAELSRQARSVEHALAPYAESGGVPSVVVLSALEQVVELLGEVTP